MGRTSDAKEKLLAVAFELIYDHSYNAVSVEQICSRADVNKGSFYYFFQTKADLVVAAYEEHWRLKESDYEKIFSSQNAPLKRLELWCEYMRENQRKRLKKYGHVCGCAYTNVGGELATQDQKIRTTAKTLIGHQLKYLTKAIADAMDSGVAETGDSEAKARQIHAFVVGLLMQAKIHNDLRILDQAEEACFALIGAKSAAHLISRTKTSTALAKA